MQILKFKQWVESADFPEPADLSAFMNHAILVCIRTKQGLAHNPKFKDLMSEIDSLSELLQHIKQSVDARIPEEPFDTDKFQGKSIPSLAYNQFRHKYPDLSSVLQVLKTIGGHYFIEKPESLALTTKIHSLLQVWNMLYNM